MENPLFECHQKDGEDQTNLIKFPEISGWKCLLFGTRELVWQASKGKVPNWFWRWMQYLFFGNKWVKEK